MEGVIDAAPPFVLVSCARQGDGIAPAEPSPEPGVDYELVSGREYRVLATGAGALWVGRRVCLRLLYNDTGARVLPEPFVPFAGGKKCGAAGAEALLELGPGGLSETGFGIGARPAARRRRRLTRRSDEHRELRAPAPLPRQYRLEVDALDGAPPAALLLRIVTPTAARRRAAPRPRAPRRLRLALPRERAAPARRPAPKRPAEEGRGRGRGGARGGAAGAVAPASSGCSVSEAGAEAAGVGELADAFCRLVTFEEEPEEPSDSEAEPCPRRLRPPPGPGPRPRHLRHLPPLLVPRPPRPPRPPRLTLCSPTPPRRPAPPRASARLREPFRHPDEASRAAALMLLDAAHAAVRAAAAAAGVRHPVAGDAARPRESSAPARTSPTSARRRRPRRRPSALRHGPLPHREGRFRARAALEDLRLSGGAGGVERVLGAWWEALSFGPPASWAAREDALLRAEHVWNALDVVAGPARSFRAWDLVPCDRFVVFSLLDRVDLFLAPHAPADPALRARAALRRARALDEWEDVGQSLELYFEAWSALIRGGLSPSPLEAELLAQLVEALLRDPAKWDLAGHFCGRLYWFTGGAEEQRGEAEALLALALEASLRGRSRAARRLAGRAAALLEPLSAGHRPLAETAYRLAGLASYHLRDLPAVFRYARLSLGRLCELHGYSYQEFDIWAYSMRTVIAITSSQHRPGQMQRAYTMDDFMGTQQWVLRVMGAVGLCPQPQRSFVVAHQLFQLGAGYAFAGEPRRALDCLARAKAHYDAYPAYFPTQLARCSGCTASSPPAAPSSPRRPAGARPRAARAGGRGAPLGGRAGGGAGKGGAAPREAWSLPRALVL
eukprot:tig00000169_g11912.t1